MGNTIKRNNRARKPIPQQDAAFASVQDPIIVQTGLPPQMPPGVLPPSTALGPAPLGPASYAASVASDRTMAVRPSLGGLAPPMAGLNTTRNQLSYENNMLLSNLTGWSVADIERLRFEFTSYANQMGVIDRDGFRRLFVASLLNATWDAVDREAEIAFRTFDTNQTGTLDFNEYITACTRMIRATSGAPPATSMYPPYVS